MNEDYINSKQADYELVSLTRGVRTGSCGSSLCADLHYYSYFFYRI
jgi:hypothetical protein